MQDLPFALGNALGCRILRHASAQDKLVEKSLGDFRWKIRFPAMNALQSSDEFGGRRAFSYATSGSALHHFAHCVVILTSSKHQNFCFRAGFPEAPRRFEAVDPRH